MHEKGQGVDQSDDEAVQWYQKAADQGFAPAQHNLGTMYCTGKGGLTQSNAKARELYQKAADQGFDRAQAKLTSMEKSKKK